MEEEIFVGVLSFKDLTIKNKVLAIDCLTPKPSIDCHTSLETAIGLMQEHQKEVLPVLAANRFVGILTKTVLVSALSRQGIDVGAVFDQMGISPSEQPPTLQALTTFALHQNQLLRTVAHDIRSPLARVSALIELSALTTDAAQKETYFQLMQENIKRTFLLLDDLYQVSGRGDLSVPIKSVSLRLSEVLTELTAHYQLDASQKGIHFFWDIEECNDTVTLDKFQFIRALDNLVSNAFKFTPAGKRVFLRLYMDQDQQLTVAIQDEGIGIPPDSLPKLFIPFSGTNREGTHGERSVGLGLSITKQILDQLQIKITIESQEGKGTQVYLRMGAGTPAYQRMA